MGIFSALFGGQKVKDLNVYRGTDAQRRTNDNDAFGMTHGIYKTDPHTFWGQNYGDWNNQNFGPGGIESQFGGGPGGGGGGYGFSRARAGHANASLIDMGDEAYQSKMRDDIRNAFVGHLRGETSAGVESGINRANATAELGGLSPAARAFMALRARTEGADTVGRGTSEYVTDAYRNALNRRGEALGTNAQLGTQASIANAGYATQASGINAGLSGQMAGLRSQENMFRLGLWDKGQERGLDRYRTAFDFSSGLARPIGQKTMYEDPGIISKVARGVGNIAGIVTGVGAIGDMFKRAPAAATTTPSAHSMQAGNSFGAYPSGGQSYGYSPMGGFGTGNSPPWQNYNYNSPTYMR